MKKPENYFKSKKSIAKYEVLTIAIIFKTLTAAFRVRIIV